MFDLSGLVCLAFILFAIVDKSLLKGGTHSRGGAHLKILLSGRRSFERGALSRGALFRGRRSFEEIRYLHISASPLPLPRPPSLMA